MLKEAWEPPAEPSDDKTVGPATAGQPFSKPKRDNQMVGDRVRNVC